MKRPRAVAVGTWVIEHLLRGSHFEALCGDLLEEFHAGRSALWCWRQIVNAAAARIFAAMGRRVPACLFSLVWTLFYPEWRSILLFGTRPIALDRWMALPWPLPALLEMTRGLLPAVIFVWTGWLIFLVLRKQSLRDLSPLRVGGSLSASLNVLLVATMWLLHHWGHPQPDLIALRRADFYFVFHLSPISIPLAASIAAAIFFLPSDPPRVARGRRTSPERPASLPVRTFQTFLIGMFVGVPCAAQTVHQQSARHHGTDAALVAALQTRLEDATKADRFSGVVMLAKDGRPIFSRAYGLADREKNIPNTLSTRFRIGSMNKMFTAVAVLQLAAAGRVRLDDPVGRYLTSYPNQELAEQVTIGDLLDNSGGTGDVFSPPGHRGLLAPEFLSHRGQLRTIDDYIRLYGDRAPAFKPGTRFAYSNFGFILLGAVIAKVSGESYYDYVREHIYRPAGMHSSGSQPEDGTIPALSVGYTRYETGRLHPDTDTLPWRGGPEGGGYSTVHDLLAFASALERHRLLDAAHTELLTTGKIDMPVNGRYAYGFMDHRSAGVPCVGHAGAWPGTNSDFEMCLGGRYVYVVLANIDPPAAEQTGFFIGSWLAQSAVVH